MNKRQKIDGDGVSLGIELMEEALEMVEEGIFFIEFSRNERQMKVLKCNTAVSKLLCLQCDDLSERFELKSPLISPDFEGNVRDLSSRRTLWNESKENLCQSFWESVSECNLLRRKVEKSEEFESFDGKGGGFLLSLTFLPSLIHQEVVYVTMRGIHHRFPLYTRETVSLDEGEWWKKIQEISTCSAQILTYDEEEEDFYNQFVTQKYNEMFFPGKTIFFSFFSSFFS